MAINKRLVMSFKNLEGSSVSLSVDEPRSDVTEAEIKAAMDLVVAKNIFAPKGLDIVEAYDAKVVVTDTTDYDLVIG